GPLVLAGQPIFVTAVDIDTVALDAVVHFLVAEGNTMRRTGAGALHTILADIFDADIDRLIDGKRKIRRNYGQVYPGAVVFMDQHAVTSQLSESGVYRQRNRIDLAARVIVGTRGITHLTDVRGQHEGRRNHTLVAEPILGVGNAAVV